MTTLDLLPRPSNMSLSWSASTMWDSGPTSMVWSARQLTLPALSTSQTAWSVKGFPRLRLLLLLEEISYDCLATCFLGNQGRSDAAACEYLEYNLAARCCIYFVN